MSNNTTTGRDEDMIDKLFDIGYKLTCGLVLSLIATGVLVVIYNLGTSV